MTFSSGEKSKVIENEEPRYEFNIPPQLFENFYIIELILFEYILSK